jgi:arylsulfatase A-like enzyme
MKRRDFLKAISMAAAGASMPFAVNAMAGKKSTARPNIVVILSDDQSWCGSSVLMDPDQPDSKSDYYVTPSIERLAKTGMRFVQGYSPAPFCCPTRRSLQIGQTPARHKYQKDQENWASEYRKQLNIPRMLKDISGDYKAAHFGKWDMRTDEITPTEMGYDESDGYTNNQTGGGKGTGGPSAKDDPKHIFAITRRACDFMEEQSNNDKPFYLQVSHYAVHLDIYYRQQTLDICTTRPAGEKHTMPEFAAMTEDMDTGIGTLLERIESLGIGDNTYIFFMSDNGGRFTMPGQQGKTRDRNYPLREGKGTMYEGGIRIPFVVIGPGVEAGSVSRVPVTGLDILPTIADLCGYEKRLPEVLDGGSMKGVMLNKGKGAVQRANPFFIFHHAVDRDGQTAIRLGDYKLVKTWDEDKLELFDLSADISEAVDLSTARQEKTQELHQLMTGFLNSVNAETRRVRK